MNGNDGTLISSPDAEWYDVANRRIYIMKVGESFINYKRGKNPTIFKSLESDPDFSYIFHHAKKPN